MRKIIIFLVLIFTTISFAQKSVLLRYNYKKGDKYLLEMNINQKMGSVMNMDMGMKMFYNISGVKDTIYNLELGFTGVTMNSLQGTESINYDSSADESKMNEEQKKMHEQMKKLLELVVAGKCSSRGRMFDFKVIKGEGTSTNLVNQMNSVTYPEKPVKVGDSWNGVHDKKEEGMKIEYVYTVKAIHKNTVDVGITGKISGIANGTVSGDMEIDKKTGATPKTNMKMDMSMLGQSIKSTVVATFKKQ